MVYCVVYIGATWCKPCNEIKPVITQLTAQFQVPLECKDYDDLSDEEQGEIKKVPTVRIYQSNTLIMEWNTNQVAMLKDWLTTHIAIGGTDDF
jgi:thioredoxin-like negative regulator of GroEL